MDLILNLLLDLKERFKNYDVNINKENQLYTFIIDKNIKLIIRPSSVINDIVFVYNLVGETTIVPIHIDELYCLLEKKIKRNTCNNIFDSIKNRYFFLHFNNLFLFNSPFHINKLIYDYMNYNEYLICEKHNYFYKILVLNKYIVRFYSHDYDINELKNNCFIYTYTMFNQLYANIVFNENEYHQVKSMSILQLLDFLRIDYNSYEVFFDR